MEDKITIGEKYGPAMKITDQDEADIYLEKCIVHNMQVSGRSRKSATAIELSNLGYYAGYYDDETRQRVDRLFGAPHPIFGSSTPTSEEAFRAGEEMGEEQS